VTAVGEYRPSGELIKWANIEHERQMEEERQHARQRVMVEPFHVHPDRIPDQVHVLGSDIRGRFIAHAIAGCESIPPVRLLIHRRHLWDRWIAEDQRLKLVRHGNEHVPRNRVIGEYVIDVEKAPPGAFVMSKEPIYHLIVTVPANRVVRALEPLKHRINRFTTICLITNGLGAAEHLITTHFPNPVTRPSIILGDLTHNLGHTYPPKQFSVVEIGLGRLHLTAYKSGFVVEHGRAKAHPPIERHARVMQMLRLLGAVPGLQTISEPWEAWLEHKLPDMIFHAVADPISVLLDLPYDQIPANSYARNLLDELMGEICAVLLRLPETQKPSQLNSFYRTAHLRRKVFQRLMLPLNAVDGKDRPRYLTKQGWEFDIDFLLGYFLRRARDLGLKCDAMKSLFFMTKAKHKEMFNQRRMEVDLVSSASLTERQGAPGQETQDHESRRSWAEPR
jgi:cytochrome b translational activator protein CBS2